MAEFFDENPTFGSESLPIRFQMDLPWLFIINPAAGKGQAKGSWLRLKPLVEASGITYTYQESSVMGEITLLVKAGCAQLWHRIVIIGGDGSMHEAINGLMASGLPIGQLPAITLLPAGSGNDWAKYWCLPHDPVKWWKKVGKWPVYHHAVGKVAYTNGGERAERYFMNVAGLAYDAWLVKQIEQKPSAKGHAFVYMGSVLRWLFQYKPQSGTVTAGGQTRVGRFYTINAGICPYSGGGMRVVPHADPQNKAMAITIAGDLPLPRILASLWRFYNGSIGQVRGVVTLFGEKLEVLSSDPMPFYVEADGEWLGECPCQITVIPAAFVVCAPGPGKR
jgi:diacylglycerol kinase (ATP)